MRNFLVALLQNVKMESRFGKYSANLKVEGDKIFYVRNYEKSRGRFPPAKDYNDLVKFQEQIYKSDRSKIVLVKKD